MARRDDPTKALPPDSREHRITEVIRGRGQAGDTRWVPLDDADDALPPTADLIAEADTAPRPRTAGDCEAQGSTEILPPEQAEASALASAPTRLRRFDEPAPEPAPPSRKPVRTGWVSTTELLRLSPLANGMMVVLSLVAIFVVFGAILLAR
ncbi:MAG: hypothetical protein AAF211_05190 [Myxococcota bacterium]